jgi:hypothetical protein
MNWHCRCKDMNCQKIACTNIITTPDFRSSKSKSCANYAPSQVFNAGVIHPLMNEKIQDAKEDEANYLEVD